MPADPSENDHPAAEPAELLDASPEQTAGGVGGWIATNRYDILWALALGLMFSVLYIRVAQDYRTMAGYTVYDNVLFDADHCDALKGWISKHKGTHPLLPLFAVPVSAVFGRVCGSYELGLAVMSGCIGGFSVILFFSLCRMRVERLPAVAVTALFGVSMNQIVFSGIPDTYILVAISIMPSFMLLLYGLRSGKIPILLWICAGVSAFSITITTLAQMAICLAALIIVTRRSFRQLIIYGVGICSASIAVGTLLVLIQHALFPDAQLFFRPDVYEYEMQYLTPLIVEHPGAVADELIKSFFLFNFVGQDPLVIRHEPGLRVELVYYRASVEYGWLAMAAVVPWLLLYTWGAFKTAYHGTNRAFIVTAWLCVGSHLVLHAFYSTDELFLYAPHYSFIVLLTAVSPASTAGKYAPGCWIAVVLLMGASNLQTHTQMIDNFGGSMPSWLVAPDAEWRYLPGKSAPDPSWQYLGFDDSAWSTGRAGFGYGDDDDTTVLSDMQSNYTTVFIRTTFEILQKDQIADLFADVNYDDGFVLYLNGTRVLARNAAGSIDYSSRATGDHEGGRARRYRLPIDRLADGRNILAAVGLNRALDSSDLSLEVRLSCVRKPDSR